MVMQGSDESTKARTAMLGSVCEENLKEARRQRGRQIRQSMERRMTV